MMYAAIALLILCGVLLFLMRLDNKQEGQKEEENAVLKAQNETLSNSPITDDDLIDSLRRKAGKYPN